MFIQLAIGMMNTTGIFLRATRDRLSHVEESITTTTVEPNVTGIIKNSEHDSNIALIVSGVLIAIVVLVWLVVLVAVCMGVACGRAPEYWRVQRGHEFELNYLPNFPVRWAREMNNIETLNEIARAVRRVQEEERVIETLVEEDDETDFDPFARGEAPPPYDTLSAV